MKNKIDSTKIISNQHDLTNAIKALKAFTDDRFDYLKSITIDDLDALSGLVACIEIASRQQAEYIVEFFE